LKEWRKLQFREHVSVLEKLEGRKGLGKLGVAGRKLKWM
jgi:hypothetical protein